MNLKQQIKDKGYRIGFIAKVIGVSNVLLSYYLNGARPMPIDVEDKIKSYLKKG